jgi:cytochrome oxidase Cu insertion factor (SCO1/SenC/PrrC family)
MKEIKQGKDKSVWSHFGVFDPTKESMAEFLQKYESNAFTAVKRMFR